MAEETITFELIRKIQMDEQKTPTLTKLPTNFTYAVANYLEQKRQIASSDRKTSLEIRSIERQVEDIVDRRERKILELAITSARTGLPPENLMEEEKEFYNSVVGLLKNRRGDVLKNFLTPRSEEQSVVFKEDLPEFVGIDERTYGPFRKGDRAKLPDENLRILLQRGVVEFSK